MTSSILWEHDFPVAEILGNVPNFLNSDTFGIITPYDVAGILQGGCASGSWMPAVTYGTATGILLEHESEVLDLIEGYGAFTFDPENESLGGFHCKLVSCGVEIWCAGVEEKLIEALEALDTEEE